FAIAVPPRLAALLPPYPSGKHERSCATLCGMNPPATTDTRDAILARAVDLASTVGLEGLTIGRLATELEMSKSGLFGHFGSKEELQLATVGAAAQRFIAQV